MDGQSFFGFKLAFQARFNFGWNDTTLWWNETTLTLGGKRPLVHSGIDE